MSVKTGSKSPPMGSAAGGRSAPSDPMAPRKQWRSSPMRLGPWNVAVNWRLAAILAAAAVFWVALLAVIGVI